MRADSPTAPLDAKGILRAPFSQQPRAAGRRCQRREFRVLNVLPEATLHAPRSAQSKTAAGRRRDRSWHAKLHSVGAEPCGETDSPARPAVLRVSSLPPGSAIPRVLRPDDRGCVVLTRESTAAKPSRAEAGLQDVAACPGLRKPALRYPFAVASAPQGKPVTIEVVETLVEPSALCLDAGLRSGRPIPGGSAEAAAISAIDERVQSRLTIARVPIVVRTATQPVQRESMTLIDPVIHPPLRIEKSDRLCSVVRQPPHDVLRVALPDSREPRSAATGKW